MNKKILWIPIFAPYKSVKHAGGRTIFFYTTEMAKEENVSLTIMSICNKNEASHMRDDYNGGGATLRIIPLWERGFKRLIRMLMNFESRFNCFNRNAGLLDNWSEYIILKELKSLKKEQYNPDIIVLHFTQVVLLTNRIKRIFPLCKVVGIEEDVAFLGYQRKRDAANSLFSKIKWGVRAKKLKEKEVQALNCVDLIVTNNQKDTNLLNKESISKPIMIYSVYYQSFYDLKRNYTGSHDILFYGAMNREENWMSVLWFVDNVLPRIKDKSIRLKVIGGNPHPSLLQLKSPQVEVLGFVEDISELFSTAMCMVAPLIMGAGIKVKLLEGFSAGLPMITNEIGIEGIPAINGVHYFHCTTAEDYENAINKLLSGSVDINAMSEKEKQLIKDNFSYHDTYISLRERIKEIVS